MRVVEKKGGVMLPDPCVECGEAVQVFVEFEGKGGALRLCTSCLKVLAWHSTNFKPELRANQERKPGSS